MAREREAAALLALEPSFQLAEPRTDWCITAVREGNGALPAAPEEQRTVGAVGQFVVRYADGTANLQDDDGDGITDESDESDFVFLRSTGTYAGTSRTLAVVLRRSVEIPDVTSSVQFNVSNPIVDLNGNAFLISGAEHAVNGNADPTLAERVAIASPAAPSVIVDQIPAKRRDQVVGAGAEPSVGQVPPIDLVGLVEQARAAATVLISPGTHSSVSIGQATDAGVVTAYAEGNVKFTGNGTGAGLLVVDGDLDIAGGFQWTGIVIVRGRVRMVGGGGTKRLIGGLVIGEEISNDDDESEVTVSGNVELLFSSAAIRMASGSLAVMSIQSWAETGNP